MISINLQKLVDDKFPVNPNKNSKRNANIGQFAQAIGVSPNAAGKIYDGSTTRIEFDTLENICKVLNCSPLDIIVSDDPQMQRLLTYQSKLSELQSNKKDGTE